MRRELKFQAHVVDSYKLHGGHASKWNTDLLIGRPDLVCCLPVVSVHFMELKHEPTFGPVLGLKSEIPNPMTERQNREARDWCAAGGRSYVGVVGASSETRGSWLGLADGRVKTLRADGMVWVPYVPGGKYNVRQLLDDTLMAERLGWATE